VIIGPESSISILTLIKILTTYTCPVSKRLPSPAMARKKESEITYPGRAHPTFTVEETKERERQQQRDKRARRKQEKSVAGPSTLGG